MPGVLYEKRDHVAWVTLNRPEAKNMMNAEVFVGLPDAWQRVREDRHVWVAVLTGAGDVDFCVGGDLRDLIPLWTKAKEPANELEARVADPRILDRVMLKTEALDKPLIGAINGRALGGGTEILLLTDIRVAADHATFGLPEPRSGIVPGAGAMARLTRQIPYAHAMKLMLTAEPITANEALAYGLISEVVPAERQRTRAEELAEQVGRNAPLSMGVIKRTVLATHTMSWEDAFRFEARGSALATRSKDAREAPCLPRAPPAALVGGVSPATDAGRSGRTGLGHPGGGPRLPTAVDRLAASTEARWASLRRRCASTPPSGATSRSAAALPHQREMDPRDWAHLLPWAMGAQNDGRSGREPSGRERRTGDLARRQGAHNVHV